MSLSSYLSDRREVLLICLSGGVFFSVLLFLFGLGGSELILLWFCFLGILFFVLSRDFLKRRKRLRCLQETLDALDQKYLLAEVADQPEDEWEREYFRLLRTAMKDMTDQVSESRRISREYRDFIEQWVHEIKSPITGIRLLCENSRKQLRLAECPDAFRSSEARKDSGLTQKDVLRRILAETERMEQDVEKVLFYARLGSVEKDYLISGISLKDCVREVLARNKQLLIQNGFCVHMDAVTHTVYSDEKWICFILNQILLNSMKYRREQNPVIEICTQEADEHVLLSVRDNGIGIPAQELERVFDKGFTGSNGRGQKTGSSSTGIGLYLCDRLCSRLGIDIRIDSQEGLYTAVFLYFPKEEAFRKISG